VTQDIRIVGAIVVPAPDTVHRDAEIALSPSSGLITYLGPRRGPLGRGDIDGAGRVVAPGLINGHTHAGISLLRGHSDDEPLQQWLTHIRAFEVLMTRDDIRAGLLLSIAEMIRGGTVGFLDMFLWDGGLLADVHDAGLRLQAAPAVFGYDAVGFPLASPQTGAEVLAGTPALAAEFAGDHLISIAAARALQLRPGAAGRRRRPGRENRSRPADPPLGDQGRGAGQPGRARPVTGRAGRIVGPVQRPGARCACGAPRTG